MEEQLIPMPAYNGSDAGYRIELASGNRVHFVPYVDFSTKAYQIWCQLAYDHSVVASREHRRSGDRL